MFFIVSYTRKKSGTVGESLHAFYDIQQVSFLLLRRSECANVGRGWQSCAYHAKFNFTLVLQRRVYLSSRSLRNDKALCFFFIAIAFSSKMNSNLANKKLLDRTMYRTEADSKRIVLSWVGILLSYFLVDIRYNGYILVPLLLIPRQI